MLKNREAAIEVIASSHMLDLENDLLLDAMEQSEALVVYEEHAMKLVATANQLKDGDIPEEMSSYKLSEDELALPKEKQINQAVPLLYSTEYDSYKVRINWDIDNTTVLIEEDLGARYRENEDDMRRLPTRQVHLDFHTSPLIPGVGEEFDKKQFQQALREGNVNSVTVFAKCHHGYCYYPTKVGTQHPTMKPGFDLTGAMVDAAHEIGVDAPIYITAGWSVLDSETHPEWCMRYEDGSIQTMNYDLNAADEDIRPNCSWKDLCFSGDYAEHIYELTREICDRYSKVDGLFYDIIYLNDACYCDNCKKGMREEGLNPSNPEDAREYYRRNHLRFMQKCTDILHEKHPEATVFFNSGGADIYRPEYHAGQTHFEMEDLPTAWGGYDKMPPRASVMSRYGKEYLGMTGKFHTEWGEFGGYKNPNALKYEALLMAMYGAKCSIGDQMLPCGRLDMETYKCIGEAYRALEPMEPWCFPAKSTAKLGVYLSGNELSDEGLHQILLEGHIDFEVVLPGDSLAPFKALILPDQVTVSDEEAKRIQAFVKQGGAVLSTGTSLIKEGAFQLNPGAEYLGDGDYRQDYFCSTENFRLPYGNAPFFCYQSAKKVRVTDGEILAHIYEPWFDRTYKTYCSHRNTPYRSEAAAHPAILKKDNVIWIAHPFCGLYKEYGTQLYKEVVLKALGLIYRPVYKVALPSGGRSRLTHQPEQKRFVLHTAYAVPMQRGCITVLEDMPEFRDFEVNMDVEVQSITQVRTIPAMEHIPYQYENNQLTFKIPYLCCHQAIEIDYIG